MPFEKKDGAKTIKDVVRRNTGMDPDEFIRDQEDSHIDQLKEAADVIREYIRTHQPDPKVTIVGDYDVDGDTASAIMYWVFRGLGVTPDIRIPRRFSEGYGLKTSIVEEMFGDDRLVVTVDNGIAAIDAIRMAKNRGYTVVVTDHHLPVKDENGEIILPPADVVLDPHVHPERSGFEDFCGAGLAYRLGKELLPNLNLVQLQVLASIGTVADVMPLVGDNRQIVKEGLEAMNQRKNLPGVNLLANAMNLDDHITEETYAMQIGPVMNASGRLNDDGAMRVVEVLTNNATPANEEKAQKLVKINDVRKGLVRENMAIAMEHITDERPIVIFDKRFHEGVSGIVAGKLQEKFHCPVIIFKDIHNGDLLKGSARSPEGIHLKDVLDKIQGHIEAYGGHAGAAGLSIRANHLEEFRKAFKEACGPMPEIGPAQYDLELEGNYGELMNELLKYAPYGEKNPKISFHAVFDTSDCEFRKMGDGTHFKIHIPRSADGSRQEIDLVGFGMADEYESIGAPKHISVIGHLTENWFRGNRTINFQLTHIEEAQPIREKTPLQERITQKVAEAQGANGRQMDGKNNEAR